MRTNAARIDPNYSIFANSVGTGTETSPQLKRKKAEYFNIHSSPTATTETTEDELQPLLRSSEHQVARQAQLVAKRRDYVDGVVSKVQDESIACELFLTKGRVVINLSKGLFPPDVRYGTPISLKLDESQGMRRPVITVRQLNSTALEEDNRKFAELVKQFDK